MVTPLKRPCDARRLLMVLAEGGQRKAALQKQQIPRRMLVASSLGMTIEKGSVLRSGVCDLRGTRLRESRGRSKQRPYESAGAAITHA